MKIDAQALTRRGRDLYADFTAGQRAMVVVAVIGLVVGGMTFMRWASAPSWRCQSCSNMSALARRLNGFSDTGDGRS